MSNNLITINFSEYSKPKFLEKKNLDWVTYGDDNRYPQHLLDLLNTSAKHNAIVAGKANYIFGNGFKFEDESYNAYLEKEINRNGETINDILRKVIIDEETFGGYYLEVIYNPLGEITSIYHIDYNKVRSNADNTMFYISEQWDVKQKPDDVQMVSAFDPQNGSGKQILYVKEYRPGINTYTLPSYHGALNYIELDVAVSEFHLNAIHNGLMPSKMIVFNNGVPSEEEQRVIERKVKEKFAGENNAGKFMINFNNDPAKAPIVLDLSASDLDKQFDLLNKTIQQEIFSGHRVTSPMLFGIKTEGQLGGRSEIRDAYEIFQNTYINEKQIFLEKTFNYLLPYLGIDAPVYIQKVEPIGFEFSEAIISANMRQNEIREKIGLSAIESSLTEQQQKLVDSISELPTNLADKVIEKLSDDVLLSLVGLQAPQTTAIVQRSEFTAEDDDFAIQVFSEFGESKHDYKIIKSRKVQFDEDFNPKTSQEFLDIIITNNQSQILDLIQKYPLITANEIAKALKLDTTLVSNQIASLEKNGLLISKEVDKNGEVVISRELSEEGKVQKQARKPLADIVIRYSYEVTPGLGDPVIPTTRDFCRNLIALDKVYSRADIERVSQRLGYSVWQQRGGFYHNPRTGVTTPYCRHRWVEQILIKK